MWQQSWGYPESIVATCGILLVGFLLQLTIGNFNFYLLAFPSNLLVGAIILILCILSLFVRKSNFILWLSGIPSSVCLISALLILTIIMGLTPQTTSNTDEISANIFSRLGFDSMTSSWAFILIYFITLLSLGCLIVRRLLNFRKKDYAFYLNHIGLWITLFAAGLGHADIERYLMHVREGEVEWRVYDEDENVKELPIAIQLNDFDMEEYPPKLTIIDRKSGKPLPEDKPDYYQIGTEIPEGQLNGWKIELKEYIHQAVRNSDSTYREVPMPGATQAQLYMTLPLDEQLCVVMSVPEPKRFMSDIEAYTPDGTIKKGTIEVNKPMRIGSWTIYQYGYDNQAGRLSSYSSMELVYDPWVIPVYIGFIFIALGSIALIWNGRLVRNRNENDNNKE